MRLTVSRRWWPVALALQVLLAGIAHAGEDDPLVVVSDDVNLRTGPSTRTDAITRLSRGAQLIERGRKGEWYFVDVTSEGLQGWIHASLVGPLGTVPPPEAPAPAEDEAPAPLSRQLASRAPSAPPAGGPALAVPADDAVEPEAVAKFRETIIDLNQRAEAVAGIRLFSDIRLAGGGILQVLTTNTWDSVPEAGRSSYLNALFERWQILADDLEPLSLQLIDEDGNVLMERSGS